MMDVTPYIEAVTLIVAGAAVQVIRMLKRDNKSQHDVNRLAIEDLRFDHNDLRADVREVKADVRDVKADVRDIREMIQEGRR